jgi:murein DD-endopeptidase MepM/ murein hydrolase activator NlpD
VLCASGAAYAQTIVTELPASVGTGEAARVVAYAPEAASFTFQWKGGRVTVEALRGPKGAYAELLLPVALDEKASRLDVRVTAPGLPAGGASAGIVRRKYPLQELKVAPAYVEPPAETRARIAGEAARVRETLARISPRKFWDLPFSRPVPGETSSAFGLRRVFNGQARNPHKGVDLRGAEGTPVLAPADGSVALADDLYFSGKVVYLDHGLGVFTSHAHLSAIEVRPGERVVRGQPIGRVGATGRVTGPHLHFACHVFGIAVNPVPLMR